MGDPFARFYNADVTARRPAETSFDGTEEQAERTILTGRADVQHQGRTVRRVRQEIEQADAVAFLGKDVSPIQPQDLLDIAYDDGRSATATVEEVRHIDDSLVLVIQ